MYIERTKPKGDTMPLTATDHVLILAIALLMGAPLAVLSQLIF